MATTVKGVFVMNQRNMFISLAHRLYRCVKDGKPCVFLEAKPRPKRAKNSKLRVEEMEEKLETLAALLATVQGERVNTPTAEAPLSETAVASVENSSSLGSLTNSAQCKESQPTSHFPSSIPYHCPIVNFPDFSFDVVHDSISKNIITFTKAEAYLNAFREHSFPWVRLPEQKSLETLRRERPFLLQSVLTFAAYEEVRLQRSLETELKSTLMKKILVEGEKSLDLLQGLLVYLAWYHFHFNVVQEQMYQLCQMAVAMMVDLGINKPNSSTNSLDAQAYHDSPSLSASSENLERRRTYLGCYYIVASLCHGLRKPSNIGFTNYTENCCQTIAQFEEYDSDHIIPYFVRLQKFAGDVNHTFDYGGESNLPELDTFRIKMLSQVLNDQLTQLQGTFPPKVWDNAAIRMTYYSYRIYVNEIGFHAKRASWSTAATIVSDHPSWYFSATRGESLRCALRAAKEYLDCFLELTIDQLRSFIVSDWVRLVYAMLILGAFMGRLDAPTFNIIEGRALANVKSYLHCLITKLDCLAISPSGEDRNPYLSHITSLFYFYQSRFQLSETWLEDEGGNCSARDFSFTDIMPLIVKKCLDWELEPKETVPEQDSPEEWEKIITSWPETLDPNSISINSTGWLT
ncbi:hypothetical protein GLAREA_10267 [Glarea lozoyensis ATCC 20868]|uniref:Transcription factor domain-containing protein n=1 Tax=Glarea lozoyensis (strain ATCC 20868 / MF5171) TaxID=1116229 RepID=S3E8B3_GLAL2|nr:uncharacterized protein GLAREA_10267 [Glarea lozoyensis ATCC 20868]EPE34573.1 hypothetical protein GLAREA_10267 [Glarea lozoyensis ATCC 20868]